MASQERLEYFISAAFKDEGVRQAMQAFGKLNAESGRVVREMEKLSQATRKTGEEIRNSRQGAAQLGMQFNQLGTQVAAGTSPFTAFAQQIGDIGYSMSFMEGKMGAVGRFLAGPWGAAISIAAVALGPLISNMMGLTEETDKASDAAKDMDAAVAARRGSEDDLKLALAKTAEEYLNIRKQMQANALVAVRTAGVELAARLKVLEGLRTEQQNMIREVQGAGGLRAGAEMGTGQILQRARVAADTEAAISSVMGKVTELENLTAKLNASTINVLGAGERAARSTANRAESVGDTAGKNFGEAYEKSLKAKMEEMGPSIFSRNIDYFMGGPIVEGMTSVFDQVNEMANVMYPDMIRAITGPNEEMIKSFESIGQAVDGAFKDMLLAGGSWRDGMRSIIQSVIDQLWKMYVTQQIVGMVTGAISGLFGGGAAAAGSTKAAGSWIGGFANGTVNAPGGMAWVGERGPELVNLPRGSQVIPAHRASQMAGGGINITVDARGSADPAAVRAQVQQGILEAAPAIIAAAQQRTVSGLRRPKLGGAMQ